MIEMKISMDTLSEAFPYFYHPNKISKFSREINIQEHQLSRLM